MSMETPTLLSMWLNVPYFPLMCTSQTHTIEHNYQSIAILVDIRQRENVNIDWLQRYYRVISTAFPLAR